MIIVIIILIIMIMIIIIIMIQYLCIAVLTISFGFNGGTMSGHILNIVGLAPNRSGSLIKDLPLYNYTSRVSARTSRGRVF